MKTELYYEDEKSEKFWSIEVSGTSYTVNYGKIGSKGASKVKEFKSRQAAMQEAQSLIESKRKKGYVEQLITANQGMQQRSLSKVFVPPADSNDFMVDIDNLDELTAFMKWLADNTDDIESRGGYNFYRMVDGKPEWYGVSPEQDPLFDYDFNANVYAFFKAVGQVESLQPYLQEYVLSVDGSQWIDEESQLGNYAALGLALADKKYIKDYISYISNNDMNHEVHHCQQIDSLYKVHGNCDEFLNLIAARCILPTQHSWEQLSEYASVLGLHTDQEQQKIFVNLLLQYSKRFRSRPTSIRYCLERLDFKLGKVWENPLAEMIKKANKKNPFSLDVLFYYHAVEKNIEAPVPSDHFKASEVACLDLVESYMIKGRC